MDRQLAHLVVLCTCPDEECARTIGIRLVEEGLAACVNVLPAVLSIYRWQDKLEQSQEYLLMAKTARERFSTLEELICELHPYEVPEVIGLPIGEGSLPYLTWLDASVGTRP